MIWIDSIEELQYYNITPGAPCYGEHLVYAADLILQAAFNNTNATTLQIEVLSADGLIVYEDATSYFDYYLFTFNGTQYYNIRLKSFSPAMCLHRCWILRVTIRVGALIIWRKYTQKYDISGCCDIPRGVTFSDLLVPPPHGGTGGLDPVPPEIPTSGCGKKLIRIEAYFPCFDLNLADYYGVPAGQTWGFKKITNIPGRIVERPREIVRNVSFNCNLQKAESFQPYLVESQSEDGIFPYWKRDEFEAMFHAPYITIDNFIDRRDIQFAGGTVAELVNSFSLCWELFKFKVDVQSCTIRQVYGCNERCTTAGLKTTFLIPENYAGGNFYSEDRQFIGLYPDLLVWYAGQDLVTSVTDVTGSYSNVYAAFEVEGLTYIPTQFYYDSPIARNRVYGTGSPVSPVVVCGIPTIGIIVVEDQICTIPVIGTIVVENEVVERAAINDYRSWDVDEDISQVELTDTYGRLNLTTFNPTIVATYNSLSYWINLTTSSGGSSIDIGTAEDAILLVYAGSTYTRTLDFTQSGSVVTMTNGVIWLAGEAIDVAVQSTSIIPYLANEIIGIIAANGRPTVGYIIEFNAGSPAQPVTISIDENGVIRYSGYPTTTDNTGSQIVLTDLIYPLHG